MKQQEDRSDHLLDYLAQQAGCMYLSDLHHITENIRKKLELAVTDFPAENASVRQWNEALAYLFAAPEEMTAQLAKEQLLKLLHEKKS